MLLEILAPEKTIFKGNVHSLKLPGSKSTFQILEYHSDIISTLDAGNMELLIDDIEEIHSDFEKKVKDKVMLFTISGGIISMKGNKVFVLID